MSINLYKKKTINNQPVLEELLSKSTDTVDNKPLVYDSTTDNVKSVDDLCVNTVTANCFCGKATCADIADVACTVCVNGVSGLRPILTVGSDGKIYNTGNCTLAGQCCITTPLLHTNYIFPTSDCNTIEIYSSKYNTEEQYRESVTNVCYTPFRCLYDQCDYICHGRICFENIMRDTDGPSINGAFCSDWACTYSYFKLGKNFTCYHRSDPINKICSTILTSCAGHIFLDTCKWDYGESIDGQGCLCLDICSNTLYSKSCLNNQYNYLIQDCNGTCICSCRSGSTYCPTTLQVCFNGIRTNSKNNIAESYLSEKPNSFILHTCDTTNCKTGSIEVDSASGYILHCTCNGNCGRVGFSQDGVTFIHNNTSSTIVGDQFSGNAATATNAVNSTCFNGCTYPEACIDIRDGLATQTCVDAVRACADAVQNCADFIQSCVSAIESKIPAQASASNQLADKAFVNSSITTNTANFRGTYSCVACLPTTGNTNNDYAFVCSLNTTTGNYIYDRYKWVASSSSWVCEYEINTTGFTAEQLASINSGITSNLVAKITDVYDNTVTVCMNGECKGSFNLNQNTDVCIDLGSSISEATNATCFNGCTYSEAKEDFRNGMAAAISIGNSCPYQADGNRVVHIPAYPPDLSSCAGINCVGTVTQVKVGTTAYDPVSGIVSLPEYPTIPTTVCTAECANTVKRNTANSGSCYLALFDGNTAVNDAGLYVSNAKQISFCPATGCLSTCYVRGISGLIAGNPIGCTSSVLGQSGTNISNGTLNLYTASPSIGFHVNDSASTSQSIIADCGHLKVCVTNGTGCTTATQKSCFYFYSDGTFTGASTICASCNIYSAGCPVVTTGTLPTVAPGYNCTGTSNYVVTTMVCCAKQVCRKASNATTYHLALFSSCTALSNADLYASCICPITYTTSNGTLKTCCVAASDCVKIGDSSACTSTQAGKNGTNMSSGFMDFYRDVPTLYFHSYNYTYATHWIEARPGHFYFYVDNGTGCTACTQHAVFCLCSNGTLTATCFCGDASNATHFNGCTYAQACTNIRSGLISDIGVAVYCGTTCKCTLCKASSLCLSANAFNANATISTSTYPGACKTGTVTSINVSVNGCSGTAVTTSGTVTLTNVPTCKIYKTMATASCNRNVLLGETTEAAGYGCVYVGNCCKLTFNPATGVLTAKCFCGCVTASGQIDCAKAIKRYQATTGTCHIALFNGTTAIDNACAYVSSSCPLTYNPATGELSTCCIFAEDLYSTNVETDSLKACGQVKLGSQRDICIFDECGNPFLCAWGNTLIMGYCSEYAVDCNCCRIAIGLNNHICIGTSCGNSVIVGYYNCVCWPNDSNLSFIYGSYNTTVDGGLAVGGWNCACCGCSVALGWDNFAGECGIAIGEGVSAKGLESIAIGCNAQANCIYSIAIGTDSKANDIDRLAIGRCSATNTYGTACVNSNIKKGPLREITVTWCDSTLKCDIWKAIACNINLRKNGKGTILTSGTTHLNVTGSVGCDEYLLFRACSYCYNSSLASMCYISFVNVSGYNIMTVHASCTAPASDDEGGGFLTITGWSR